MGDGEVGDALACDLRYLAQHCLRILRPHACVDYQHTMATNDDPNVWNQIYPLVWYHVDVFSNLARLTAGYKWRLVLRADHSRESENNQHGSTTSKILHVLRLPVVLDKAGHFTSRASSEQPRGGVT